MGNKGAQPTSAVSHLIESLVLVLSCREDQALQEGTGKAAAAAEAAAEAAARSC